MATRIRGIEGLKHGELEFELQRGAQFVLFQYCISVVMLTFRRPSDIYFLRAGENPLIEGLPFTLLSLVRVGGAFLGGRPTPFRRCTTILAEGRTSPKRWSIQGEPKPGQRRRLLPRFLRETEGAEFRKASSSGKL